MTKPPITIDRLWTEFDQAVLQTADIKPDSRQHQEMKKAFYSGAMGLLMSLKVEVANRPEAEGVQILERMEQDIFAYFESQILA